jgi:hypothetical protein
MKLASFTAGFIGGVWLWRWLNAPPCAVWLYVRDKPARFHLDVDYRLIEVKGLLTAAELSCPPGFGVSRVLWDEDPAVYKLAYNLVTAAPQYFDRVCTRQS